MIEIIGIRYQEQGQASEMNFQLHFLGWVESSEDIVKAEKGKKESTAGDLQWLQQSIETKMAGVKNTYWWQQKGMALDTLRV